MKRVIIAITIAAVLFSFASCDSEAMIDGMNNKTVRISFSTDDGSKDAAVISATTDSVDSSSVYWYYTATKNNGGGVVGAVSDPTAEVTSGEGANLTHEKGLLSTGHEFSIGNWTFELYGFLTSQKGETSIEDSTNAEANCIYYATWTGDLKSSQTISMDASPFTTGSVLGTLSVTTTHAVADGGSAYTVKYKLSSDTEWKATGDQGTTSSVIGDQVVTLGLFDANDALVESKNIYVTVFRGLTTTIGGGWEDPTVTGKFSVTNPDLTSAFTKFAINDPSLSNVTASEGNAKKITADGSSVTLTFAAAAGYTLPESVSVTGAEYVWTQSSGTLVLSNPISAVSISITAVQNQ